MNDTIPNSIVITTNAYSFGNDEKKRREGALTNKDFYYGRQEKYLSLVNEDMDAITVNLSNPVITKRSSLLYTRPLVREFDGPAASVKALESIYENMQIDDILHQVDLSSELTGTALVFVGVPDEESENTSPIELRVFDAADFSVVAEDDNTSIEALQLIAINDLVSMPSGGKNGNIQVKRVIDSEVWTDSYIHKVRDGIVQSGSEVNELGYIPFVSFKAQEVITQYLGHSPTTSVRQMNASYNQTATNLGYTIKMQAATPIVLNGFSNGESVSVHPGTAISLPVGASAGALQLNPKIGETMEFLSYLEDKIYETSSMPKISVLGNSTGSTSGVELLIKWAPIKGVFTEKSNRYQTYELNLANMILKRLGMEPIDNILVHFPDDYMPFDQTRELLEEDIKLGIRTPIDEVLKLNPTLNEADAEAEVRANLEFNKSLTKNTEVKQDLEDPNGNEQIIKEV